MPCAVDGQRECAGQKHEMMFMARKRRAVIDDALMGRDRIVGVTCHNSRDLAYSAAEAGADYVAFGAFYPTGTKEPSHWAEPELLEIWQETMETPCVAIGGITVENAEPLVRAGADFLAVSAGVWAHADGPRAAVSTFNELFDRLS